MDKALTFGRLGEDYDAALLARDRALQYFENLRNNPDLKAGLRLSLRNASFEDGSAHVLEALNAILPDGIDAMLTAAERHLEKQQNAALTKLREAMAVEPVKPPRR